MSAALVIQPDGSITELPDLELATLQQAVGGWVQAIPLGDQEDATAWMNEEGKLMGLEVNAPATVLCATNGSLLPGDYIVGALVVSGGIDDEGESLPITTGWIEKVNEFIERFAPQPPTGYSPR